MSVYPAQHTIAFYEPLKAEPLEARRVGWESDGLHELRLRALVEAAGPTESAGRILDIGCGEGKLIALLRSSGFVGSYRGEDILPHMIERAASKQPDEEFVVVDSFADDLPTADILFCCGTLNTGSNAEPSDYFRRALGALWKRTERSLVIDFAVADRHSAGSLLTTYDLLPCLDAARKLSRHVRLVEESVPGEAILVLHRTAEIGLERIPETAHLGLTKADIHLQTQEPEAARRTLMGESGLRATLLRALADAQSGRVRDAEATLRQLARQSDEADLHLGILLMATRRQRDGLEHLESLRARGGQFADAARFQLLACRSYGTKLERRSVLDEIQDPWIRREARVLLGDGT